MVTFVEHYSTGDFKNSVFNWQQQKKGQPRIFPLPLVLWRATNNLFKKRREIDQILLPDINIKKYIYLLLCPLHFLQTPKTTG
jgi:hypothetical protein